MTLAARHVWRTVHFAQLGDVALLSASVYAIALFAVISISRFSYPFELEWMEGAILDHIQRAIDGQSLYGAPSVNFTPFIYPPFYYELCSLLGARTGFAGPRLVSVLATAGTMLVIFWVVRRTTSSRAAGTIAAGLYASTFPTNGFWFDLARVDSLFVFLLCAAHGAFVCLQSTWSGIAAAILLAMACFTKQTAVILCAPLLLHCILRPSRRSLATFGTFVATSVCWYGWENARSGGWFRFYVLEAPRHHPIDWSSLSTALLEFADSPAGFGLVAVTFAALLWAPWGGIADLCRDGWRRRQLDRRSRVGNGAVSPGHWWRLVAEKILVAAQKGSATACGHSGSSVATVLLLIAGIGTAIGASLVSRLHMGGYVNVWMPGCAATALALGMAYGFARSRPAPDTHQPPASRAAFWLLTVLVLAGEVKAMRYSPAQQIPTSDDELAGQAFLAFLRSHPGPVLVLDAGHYARLTGHPSTSHPMALADLYKMGNPEPLAAVSAELREAIRSHTFQAIVGELGLGFLPPEIAAEIATSYRKTDSIFGTNDYRFMTKTGCPNRPSAVWEPR